MATKTLTRATPVIRNQKISPALENTKTSAGGKGKRFRELAGEMAAGCTAICCCCPLTVMDFVILVFYKVPSGLCRKAWRERKRKRLLNKKKKHGLLATESGTTVTSEEMAAEMERIRERERESTHAAEAAKGGTSEDIWEPFFHAGFGRSASQLGRGSRQEELE